MHAWLLLLGTLALDDGAPAAALAGVVRDAESGLPIAGAVVSLPALRRAALSDSLGRYLLPEISAGTQQVTVRRIGYSDWSVTVLVPEGGSLTLDFALRPDPVPIPPLVARAQPTRAGAPASSTTASPFLVRALDAVDVAGHPLLAEPDYLTALAGGEVLVAPETADGIQVAGASTDQVAILLDGIPVFNPYHAGGTFAGWNPDLTAAAELTTAPTEGPAMLGGALSVRTIAPGDRAEFRGALSATHTRAALRAPLGSGGAGFVLGMRSGFAGLLGHPSDASYLGGRNGDWMAKLELPALGGRLALLGYGGGDELSAAPAPTTPVPLDPATSHRFSWDSRSVGLRWSGALGDRLLVIRAWHAGTTTGARWMQDSTAERLHASRNEGGAALSLSGVGATQATSVGLELATSGNRYRNEGPGTPEALRLSTRQPRALLRVDHRRSLGTTMELRAGAATTLVAGRTLLDPSLGLSWRPAPPLTLSAGVSRRHQLWQSLRNPEAVTGALFPVDLMAAGGQAGLPLARADLFTVGAELRPGGVLRASARVYGRSARGLALVALLDSGPSATRLPATGRGRTLGAAIELEAVHPIGVARLGYGYQDTRVAGAGQRYQPAAAPRHNLNAGITLRPLRQWELRAGFTGQFGRRATLARGPFEWESCNLRDRGCEFAGTPVLTGPRGALRLPAYARLDLGLRYELSPTLLGRRGTMAAYGTLSNLLSRRNLLTYATADDGSRDPVDLRPRAPLVVGIDWRF